MPITEKEALEIFGASDLSKYESADQFREAVEKDWVKRTQAHSDKSIQSAVISKVNRVALKRMKDLVSELGLTVDEDVIDGDFVDVLPKITELAKGRGAEMEELRKKAEKALPDDVAKDFEKKLKAITAERDTFASQAKEFQGKYEGLETEVKNGKRKSVIDSQWSEALGGIQFHQGVDELRKKGFIASVKEKYRIDLDDEFNPKMVDMDGKPVKHPKKAGEFWSLKEALETEARAAKLLPESPHANKVIPPKRQVGGTVIPTGDEAPTRFIAKPLF